ncbi:MAG: serine hydrolase domain-containing protein [Acidimicrobiales bacterium]|nr:serine hydrolase domain-containing protein [Acidimicrobiales bacterium]
MTETSGGIRGTVADGFDAVRDAFEANFTEHGDVGAGTAVFVDGECVVDLTGGVTDPEEGRPYDADTLQLVFSSTKGVAAIAAHLLVQRGQLDVDARVADLWPEFAQNGKEDVTVAQVLSHRVGLPVIDERLSLDQVVQIQPVVDALAAQAPMWEPGTAHGYHALTFGWLVGEIVKRVDGRTIGEFVADELAGPLDLDLWIGLPEDQDHRIAPLIASMPGDGTGDDMDLGSVDPEIAPLLGELATAFLDPESTLNRALHLNGAFMEGEGLAWNRPEVWRSQIPAANGITNARSLAKLYSSCVVETDGVRMLDDETVARATEEHSNDRDQTLVVPTRFGLGFFLPSTFSPLMGGNSFGHAGAGGSLGLADPDRRVGFAYVMNRMSANLSNDQRTAGLIDAVKGALD